MKELVHAVLVELKHGTEPVDIILHEGSNEIFNLNAHQMPDLSFKVENEEIGDIYRSLAILSSQLVNSPLGHTLRCCLPEQVE